MRTLGLGLHPAICSLPRNPKNVVVRSSATPSGLITHDENIDTYIENNFCGSPRDGSRVLWLASIGGVFFFFYVTALHFLLFFPAVSAILNAIYIKYVVFTEITGNNSRMEIVFQLSYDDQNKFS
jgi:hypothetical protein